MNIEVEHLSESQIVCTIKHMFTFYGTTPPTHYYCHCSPVNEPLRTANKFTQVDSLLIETGFETPLETSFKTPFETPSQYYVGPAIGIIFYTTTASITKPGKPCRL
ncbi:hypothetical protein ACI65C_000986 [Semiaphis heraclei]